MADSTAKVRPSKPREDFPLFAHRNGLWAKKVKGKLRYFGSWQADPQGKVAEALWNFQQAALLACLDPRPLADGRTVSDLQRELLGPKPRPKGTTPQEIFKELHGIPDDLLGPEQETRPDGLTVRDLCNEFMDAKEKLFDSNELSKRSLADYDRTCKRLVAYFGKNRLISDLEPVDFRNLRANIAKTSGPVTLGNELVRVRMLFNFAFSENLVEKPVKYGSNLKRPSARVLDKHRLDKGERTFTARQIRRLLKAATPSMRAAILLGINCGFGNSDIGKLPKTALDLRHGWAVFPRPKTSVKRKCPLWPETINAVREAMAINPKPARPEYEGLALLQSTGYAWSKSDSADSPISKAFRDLLDSLDMYRPGLSFYTLRHCHRTVSDAAGDPGAANAIMGHKSRHISESYIESREDSRLIKVSNHVRRWLFRRGADAPAWQPVKGGQGDE